MTQAAKPTKVYAHRPTEVEAVQFDGTMGSFNAIHDWMESIEKWSNLGHSGSEAEGTFHFGVRGYRPDVVAGDFVLHRFVGGVPRFWVLKPWEFAELYDERTAAN